MTFMVAINLSIGSACSASASARSRPAATATSCDMRAASSAVRMCAPPEKLCMMALWNRPRAGGNAIKVATFAAPPDWPKMVTLSGSPPKPATLSRTHLKARTMSSTPVLPESAKRSSRLSSLIWPKILIRWLIVTTTTSPSRARLVPSKPGAEPAQFIQAPPCSHIMTGFFVARVADGVNTLRNRQSSLTGWILVYHAAIG